MVRKNEGVTLTLSIDIVGVTGSIPVAPTTRLPGVDQGVAMILENRRVEAG
jgi:hypothetical protein